MADRHNAGKPALSLIPPEILEGLARVYEVGVTKYGRDNWREGGGLSWTETYDAGLRHAGAWLRGEDLDVESGLPPELHAAWAFLTLYYYRYCGNEFNAKDDRFPQKVIRKGMERGEKDMSSGVGKGEYIHLKEGLAAPKMTSGIPGDTREVLKNVFSRRDPDELEPTASIAELQREIASWADEVFPARTAQRALTKLMLEEIPELLIGGHCEPQEFADVIILVLDIAHLQGIDIGRAVREKMEVNRSRVWRINEETGLMNHVKTPKGPLE